MLLATASNMNRKPLALAIVLMLAVLSPAAAIIGFCTRMPCCKHAAAQPLAFSTEANDCCTTIACYESPSAKLAKRVTTSDLAVTMPAIAPVALAPPPPHAVRQYIDTSPPVETRHRLAILSTLLI